MHKKSNQLPCTFCSTLEHTKNTKTQITPAYMHNILCKNDTNMSNFHKFAQQGAIMEQITNHKTHLNINSMGFLSSPCLAVRVIWTQSYKYFLTSLRRFSPKVQMNQKLCHGVASKTILDKLLTVYDVSLMLWLNTRNHR